MNFDKITLSHCFGICNRKQATSFIFVTSNNTKSIHFKHILQKTFRYDFIGRFLLTLFFGVCYNGVVFQNSRRVPRDSRYFRQETMKVMKDTASSRKNVTIGDIAKAAGVSRTTVSRYLNGKYSMMSADTRSRIETVIQMSNYHPNSLAQSLRGRCSMQIGVVVSDISSPFCSSMVRAVGHTLLEAGYVSLTVDSKDDPEVEQHLIQTLLHLFSW